VKASQQLQIPSMDCHHSPGSCIPSAFLIFASPTLCYPSFIFSSGNHVAAVPVDHCLLSPPLVTLYPCPGYPGVRDGQVPSLLAPFPKPLGRSLSHSPQPPRLPTFGSPRCVPLFASGFFALLLPLLHLCVSVCLSGDRWPSPAPI